MRLSGWGRYPRIDGVLVSPRGLAAATEALATAGFAIARGNGRSYGDAALSRDTTVSCLRGDRILAFDQRQGVITVEGGLLLADLLDFVVPRGFFPPVTPGTKFVTIAGMVAADVHGKNHHQVGTIGRFVERLDLLLADGSLQSCGPDEDKELFDATCGGMGLTGLIMAVTLRLLPIRTRSIRQETFRAPDLSAALALCEAAVAAPYAVAWIDCLASGASLGRSLIFTGIHAASGESRPRRATHGAPALPVDLPGALLNRTTVKLFNTLYYRAHEPGVALVDYDRYFYPLDGLGAWNRLYGAHGFVQHQSVLPEAASPEGLRALLLEVSAAGTGSFLAVLKRMGPAGDGYLSFPMEGYTLALDFPVTPANLALLDRLDAIVAEHGGRIYLAKDARTTAVRIEHGYPRLPEFRRVRNRVDPDRRFASLMSERLGL